MKVAQSCPTLWPHGLCSPWNSPGQNFGVGSCSLLQEIFPTQGLNPGLPQSRQILYQLSHQWSPIDLIMHMQKRPVGILRGCSFWYRCGDGEEQPQLEDTKPTQILLPFFPTKLGRVTKNDVPPVLKWNPTETEGKNRKTFFYARGRGRNTNEPRTRASKGAGALRWLQPWDPQTQYTCKRQVYSGQRMLITQPSTNKNPVTSNTGKFWEREAED